MKIVNSINELEKRLTLVREALNVIEKNKEDALIFGGLFYKGVADEFHAMKLLFFQ